MAGGYKLRLGDGSEIGPMDLAALQTWVNQGLVDGESPVMRPGSRKWVPLSTLTELRGAPALSRRAPSSRPGRARPARARPDEPEEGDEEATSVDRWRVWAAGGLLIALAGGLGYLAFRPQSAHPAFDGAPWWQMALGALALGLALLAGWDLGRRVVRIALLLVAFALFPVAGILIAQGERGTALAALGAAWLLVSGLFVLLARSLGWAGLALALLPILGGAYGIVRFGVAPATGVEATIRGWSTPDRRFTDDAQGLTLQLPAGWVILKPGNPVISVPGARVTLAAPRSGGFGFLVTEPAPKGVATADQYLDQLLARRKAERPGLEAGARSNAIVGAISGRTLEATWKDGEVPEEELVVAGLDGWMAFALVAWMPEAAASRTDGLDALGRGLAARGILAVGLQKAVDAAVAAVPHLTPSAAEQLMAESEARVLEPDQAFRRSLAALARLLPSLSKAETRELGGLTSAAYAGVPWADRSRLASYVERVRRGDTTRPAEDREMMGLMKTAEEALSPARRMRLQAYYEKAIGALSRE
jgi:hypothetical protein